MRAIVDAERVRSFIQALGERSRGPGSVYFTGGATAVLYGWRASTVDIDLKMDPEPPGAFEAIGALKDELDVNVELAAPDQFVPVGPNWKSRGIFIGRSGEVDFFHYDPLGQAMAKIERGHGRDLADVDEMILRGLVSLSDIRGYLKSVDAELLRYPAIDRAGFATKIAAFLQRKRGP
jgi:hypothetical protein